MVATFQLTPIDLENLIHCLRYTIDNANMNENDHIIINEFETIDPIELEMLIEGLEEQSPESF